MFSKRRTFLKETEIEEFFEQDALNDENDSDESDFGIEDSIEDPNFLLPEDNSMIDQVLDSSQLTRNAVEYSLNKTSMTVSNNAPVADTATSITNADESVATPINQPNAPNSSITIPIKQGVIQTKTSCGVFTGIPHEIKNDMRALKSVIWKKKHLQLHENDLLFENSTLPEKLNRLKTPYECFKYFLTDDFLKGIAAQMNLYARQKDIATKFKTDAVELRKFVGILFFMSVYRYPNCREYWGKYSLEPIRQAMTCNRFEELRHRLHFNDSSIQPQKGNVAYDPLYKVRPVIDHFNNRFVSVPMLQHLCVDEQMCPTKMGRNPIRQYMPAKPHKWGAKLFVLCDSSGFSYAFEIYCGSGDNKILPNCPNLGAASNVVVRLSRNIPNKANHILYFDNFYTSMGLLLFLKSCGIHSLGTVRANRVPNIKLSNDAALMSKKVERGYNEEYVASVFGVDITSVLWFDTRAVRLLSTYVGTKASVIDNSTPPTSKIKRWDRKLHENVEVSCPAIIKEYNKHMGGVDLMDSLIGRYRIKMKTKKWTNRLFFHLLDVAMVNSYILYNRIHRGMNNCPLPQFRTEVAETLCLLRSTQSLKRGRPMSSTPPPKLKRTYVPNEDVRFDQVAHWCQFLERSGKKMCKMPGCKSETQAFCIKCKINLCNSTSKTCFFDFHNKK